jgi:CRP-like cAMP-binding protein
MMMRSFDHIQKNFNAGETVYEIGDRSEHLYLIHSGTVSIRTRHGLEVGILTDGEIFGEVGRVIGSPRTVTAKAKSNCTLYEINWENLQKKLDGADAVLVAIIRGLSMRIGDANDLAEKYWRELSIYKSLE